jgi:hypothetical protein
MEVAIGCLKYLLELVSFFYKNIFLKSGMVIWLFEEATHCWVVQLSFASCLW